ncbi:MAG TPA: hypothetical protein VMU04_25035 [Candidatus Acidoferrum sp.]|nr:hypothetical protein [Candidatus Acidoferrum sp.]
MKQTSVSLRPRPCLRGLVLALAATALSSYVTLGVPYASQITRSGNTVSFVLNQNAQGLVVLRNGANPTYPGTNAGPLSFDMTGFTTYSIIVTGSTVVGWSQYVPDGWDRNFWYPSSVSINKNPASTNFGKVYICNNWNGSGSTAGGRITADGMYVLRADGVALGSNYTGGLQWTSDGTSYSRPYKSCIGPDDHLYVTSYYDDLAFEFNDDMSVATQLIDASNKSSGQYVESLWVEGTQAAGNRKLYLVDSHYLDTRVGLIEYDLNGNATATSGDTGTQVIGPTFFTFYPRDVGRDKNGNWYMSQYRASTGQAPAVSRFDGTLAWPINTSVWDTSENYIYTLGLAINDTDQTVAVGSVSGVGPVDIFDMNTGAFIEEFRAGNNIRRLDYDIAGNLVTVDNSTEYVRFWSRGGYTVATTKSDGTFSLMKPSINVSVAATTDTTSMDTTQPPGVFTFTRTGDTTLALPVGYTLTGTATNGVQYQHLSGTVTIPASASSQTLNVVAIPYSPAGPTRSVILSINTSNTYSPSAPTTDTVWIVDTNTPTISISLKDSQFYERTNDFARFTLTRLGDTNVSISSVNLTYGGTAVQGTQWYPSSTSTNFNNGDQTVDIYVLPIHDGVVTGPSTVTATVAPAGDGSYIVGTPSTAGPTIRVDSDDPPETVIWSDSLSTDTSANWTYYFGTTNGAALDYTINVEPDFSSLPQIGSWPFDYGYLGIPSAPHTTDGSTKGLYLTVNKNDTQPAAGALNFYPTGQRFSGNYALRFDMFLMQNNSASTTEYALFGINHDGLHTNWFRSSPTGFNGVDPTSWSFDGLFYDVEADGSALGDYVGWSAPTTANHNPTPLPAGSANPGVNASSLTSVFKTPPWTPGAGAGGAAANEYGTSTPIWADVELAQVNGVVSWYINHTLIFAYTNATPYTSGNIMLGYEDGYDSIGSRGGSVIYANARVISLANPHIAATALSSGNVVIRFTANAGDVPGQFTLQQSSPSVRGAYTDTSSVITSLGGGSFQAVKALGANPTFYRIRRLY